jgi:hypothetical protein
MLNLANYRIGAGIAAALALALTLGALAGCGKSEEYNRKAYEVCVADGKKPDSKLAKAKFAAFEGAKVASSTGDDQFRVNIPYELNGEKGLFQCIAEKNQDGSFKAVF